ncbi:MAG: ABC transporter permease [Parachlamydiales bacterium]|jgi:ABC-2 type transport system permease protein
MSGSARRLKALIIKESFQIVRDPSSILIAVILPLILMFIYGYGVSLDIDHLNIGLVMEDTRTDAQSFAESLTNSPYFNVKIAHNRKELYTEMAKGHVRGIVIVPFYFSEFLHNNNRIAPIQILADGSEPNTASFVRNYVQGAWNKWLEQRRINDGQRGISLVQLQSRVWYNEEVRSRDFLLPGSLGIIMSLIGILLTALVVAREWERGTMEALMATPIRIIELVFGKLIPYFFLGMMSMLLCAAITIFFYEVPFRGSFFALLVVSSAFLFAALGMGLFISTVSKNQFVASQAAVTAAFLPGLMLSGFIFEISSMPKIIQWISSTLAARYFVSAMKTLFLVGDVWSILLYDIGCILIIAAFFYILTSFKTVKRLD